MYNIHLHQLRIINRMKLMLRELSTSINNDKKSILGTIITKLKIAKSDIISYKILRRALDARNKKDIRFKYTVVLEIENNLAKNLIKTKKLSEYIEKKPEPINRGTEKIKNRPVVVGAGPCGLFAAYTLAKYGFNPLIIERGKPIDERKADVELFHKEGKLNVDSNICFGEGGAGTFSDGKLTTRIKDLRAREVLKMFVKCGADEDILIDAKPHLGTDGMQKIIKKLRDEIINLGGEFIFNAKLCDISTEKGQVNGIKFFYKGDTKSLDTDIIILAIGHSAKDTYRMLFDKGIHLEKKACAIGFRIEHKRTFIDDAQYGDFARSDNLGAAEYTLTAKIGDRGVYSFCMCPGGVVVCSASSENELCINGMSYSARDMENSNSAIVATLLPSDSEDHPLGGLKLIEEIEKRAYNIGGGYKAPTQKASDFIKEVITEKFDITEPSYRPKIVNADLNGLLPKDIERSIKEGLKVFDRRIKGFIENGVLTGVETRSSSPIRLTRDETMQSINLKGLMPGGEGAGYAGGIISAAVDGIKIGEHIAKQFSPE